MKNSGTIYLILNALIFAIIGVSAFANPLAFTKTIDFALTAPAAMPEFLATFGGLMVMIGVAIGLAVVFRRHRKIAFLLIVMAYAGFGSGRLIGMLAHSGFDWRNGLFFATEILLILWGTACYLQERKQGHSAA
ncbi:hypothetical protein AUP74_01593 [Microbulbifer aggregans]|uniref:DUF4345 domain-containing protein n=1 Tax=Microbulbifer aggregans TaxID=1769779 RepID=A0A1C9W7D0_9GAMM|nr:DUF4345 family protein [Microbulbifer aggregans]AOS97028.1 hypothetical protein AUP74_01593 [Microbulbifer aggregans]